MGTSKLSTTHYHNLQNMFSQSANKKWHFTNLKLCPLDDSTSVWWSGTRYACLWSDCINSPYMNFNRHILSIRRLEKLVKSRDCPDGYRSGRPHVTLKRKNKHTLHAWLRFGAVKNSDANLWCTQPFNKLQDSYSRVCLPLITRISSLRRHCYVLNCETFCFWSSTNLLVAQKCH